MPVSLIEKLNLTPLKPMLAFSLTEALLAAVLVGVVSALAIGALNVSGQIQGIQSNKIVQAAMMEIQSAATKYKQRNGMVSEADNPSLLFSVLDATAVPNGQLINSSNTTNSQNCGFNDGGGNITECRRLKSGAIVSWFSWPTLSWGGTCTSPLVCGPILPARNIHVLPVLIDPDGVFSSSTNDAGQSTSLLFTMQGHFLRSTETQLNSLTEGGGSGTPLNLGIVQPNYFRLDK